MAPGDARDGGPERRSWERFPTRIEVDYRSGETFLFAYIENISEMGIFVASNDPLPVGARIELRFEHEGQTFEIDGEVAWINPVRPGALNPGMGVRFTNLTPEHREQVVELVRTIAYLHEDDSSSQKN
jgi:type IV pilus assembly protein PilZ